MKKILLSVTTVVYLMGFCTLAFADEMGKMKGEMKAKKDEMKGEMKMKKDEMNTRLLRWYPPCLSSLGDHSQCEVAGYGTTMAPVLCLALCDQRSDFYRLCLGESTCHT